MDTIFALSSGALPAGVAVVRLSGPAAGPVLEALCGRLPEPRVATLSAFRDPQTGGSIDRGLALWLPGPASFTGEDCAEFHCHGSRAVIARLYEVLSRQPGLRIAEPGEFARRAFHNGKLDLTEVEGLSDLIQAETEAQRRQALALAGGALARLLEGWRAELIGLRAAIEARLDFADEDDVPEALPADFFDRVRTLRAGMAELIAGHGAAERVRTGFRVALVGRPNVGKSTLLNAFAGRDVAIVTEEPGTTRDVLEVPLDLGGYPVILCDTAGLREAASLAETEGVRRARLSAERADLVLLLDDMEGPPEPDFAGAPVWRVRTKIDLVDELGANIVGVGAKFAVSARTREGLGRLQAALAGAAAEGAAPDAEAVLARPRQLAAVRRAEAALAVVLDGGKPDEVIADLLRQASDEIGRLTGRVEVEDVLDRLFAEFCIGK
jgi:tRNA modification GTPase